MKKRWLLITGALLISMAGFSQKEPTHELDPNNPNLLEQCINDTWEGGGSFNCATKTLSLPVAWSSGGGWSFGSTGANLSALGYKVFTIKYEKTDWCEIKILVQYYNDADPDAPGNKYQSSLSEQKQNDFGEITIEIDKVKGTNGRPLPVKAIYVQAAKKVDVIFSEALFKGCGDPGVFCAPDPIYPPVTFEDFDIGYHPDRIHGWGWRESDDVEIVADPLNSGERCMKLMPTKDDMAAVLDITLCNKTVADIEAITFDVYWGENPEGAAEDGFIYGNKALLFIGSNDIELEDDDNSFQKYPVSFISYDDEFAPSGEVGKWFTYEVKREDFTDDFMNYNLLNPEAPDYTVDFSAVDELSSFRFGIGFNPKDVVYYIDNIRFIGAEGGGCMSINTIKNNASQMVYSTDGGIVVKANGEKVSIYGVDGSLVKQTIANGSVISLAKGLYIVKVGANAEKAIVK